MGVANSAHDAAVGLDVREAPGLPSRDLKEAAKHGLQGKASVAGRSEKARIGRFVGDVVRAGRRFRTVRDGDEQFQR
jgi:hypothetical protein